MRRRLWLQSNRRLRHRLWRLPSPWRMYPQRHRPKPLQRPPKLKKASLAGSKACLVVCLLPRHPRQWQKLTPMSKWTKLRQAAAHAMEYGVKVAVMADATVVEAAAVVVAVAVAVTAQSVPSAQTVLRRQNVQNVASVANVQSAAIVLAQGASAATMVQHKVSRKEMAANVPLV